MHPYSSSDVVRSPAHSGAAHAIRPEQRKMETPFPSVPMVVIVTCLVTEMYTLCNLFPYAGYMVQHLGVADDKDESGQFAWVRLDRTFLKRRLFCRLGGCCCCCCCFS